MINIPEKQDLREIQKQINAIYNFLKVHPLYYATTREIGIILQHDQLEGVDLPNAWQVRDQAEIKQIRDQFLD